MTALPARAQKEHFSIGVLVALLVIHAGALAAPWTFSWPGLIAFLVLYFITGCLGVTLCYHRLLSHRSFKTHKWFRTFLMLCGSLSLQGDPASWTAVHRLHHRESDQEGDPHSPRVNFLWAHIIWLLFDDPRLKDTALMARFIPDLLNDRGAQFLSRFYLPINILVPIALFGLGWLIGGPKIATSMLVWGGFLRIVWVWHCTWFVNSVTHLFGYRNYETRDDSRNLWWVALLAYGEGWHNNHHAHPSAARSGHRWWEIDVTYGVMRALQMVGLAWRLLPITSPKPATILSTITHQSAKTRA